MNISTSISNEYPDSKKPSGGYEWWYFDGMSDNGVWSFVIIFYEGNPFSPRYIHSSSKKEAKPGSYPAISISIYKEGKAEYYSFLEFKWDSFSCNREDFTIKIGKSGFKRSYENGELQYQLNLDQILASGHSLVGTIEFSSAVFEEAGSSSVKEEMNEQHFWNLLQPMAGVKADFEINGRNGFENVSFNGSGYHDHNTGYEPMKDSFRDWYWGRFHFEKHTLLYYVMNKLNGSRQHEAWLIDHSEFNLNRTFKSIKLNDKANTILNLPSYRKIRLEGDEASASVLLDNVIDNGPFYQRFLGKATLTIDGSEQTVTGIAEYIRPDRIYDKKYWWMINMRLNYTYSAPHWVQNVKWLYERTW